MNPSLNRTAFGMVMPEREYNVSRYRFGYNGKEMDNEVSGESVNVNFEFRSYDVRLGRFLSRDPSEFNYPWQSTYAYYSNSPISVVDYLGAGDYYDKNGKHFGADKSKDDKVYTVEGNAKGMSPTDLEQSYLCSQENDPQTPENLKRVTVELTSISQNTLVKFASAIYDESSGGKSESYAIANAFVNYSNDLNNADYTIDKLVSRPNHYSFGVSSEKFNSYYKLFSKGKGNGKFALGAALNALSGGNDFANGGSFWDGGDLAHWDWTNSDYYNPKSHRNGGISVSDDLANKYNSYYRERFSFNCFVPLINKSSTSGAFFLTATQVHGGTIFFRQTSGKITPRAYRGKVF